MARKLKIDFTGVESFVRCEEGQHVARIKEVNETNAAGSGSDMLDVRFEVIKGASAGAVVRDNLVLSDKALWKLKNLMETIGMKADGKIVIDIDKFVGKTLIIEVKHEEYNGSTRANVSDYRKLTASKGVTEDDDFDGEDDYDDEEDEAPKKPSKPADKKPKPKPEPEPEEDDDDDYGDDDEDDDEPEETPKQKKARQAKEAAEKLEKEAAKNKKAAEKKAKEKAASAKAKKAQEPEDDEDDDFDDWDDEE